MTMEATVGKWMREAAEKDGSLKLAGDGVAYALKPGPKYVTVTVWLGKAGKPADHLLCKTEADALEVVGKRLKQRAAYRLQESKRKAARAEAANKMRAEIKVGDILVYSWGYEQTNIDYFQVVEKSPSGATVKVREIASKTVESTGPMSARVAPVPGAFLEKSEVMTKKVSESGVRFEHGNGYVVKEGETHHCSWYY
jgi:hypothetical protein